MDGMYKPVAYLEKAKSLGMTAFAQTNHGNMSGAFEFYDAAKQVGIKPILGVEAYFVNDNQVKGKEAEKNKHIILLAKNEVGFRKLLKAQYFAAKEGLYYRPRIDWKVLETLKGDVIVSSACISGVIARYINNALNVVDKVDVEGQFKTAEKNAERLKEMFGDDFYFEYVALERTKVYGPVWIKMQEIAKKLKIKSIITIDTHYLTREDAELQDVIHNVDNDFTMEDIKKGKGWVFDDRDVYLKSYDEVTKIMTKIFNEETVQKFLENTNEIANKIEKFEIYPKGDVFPRTNFDESKIRGMLVKALDTKINQNKREKYIKRLNYEYKIIKKLGFLEYFWIVQEIVNWSKQNGVEVGVSRGSAGGCLVSYLLNITEIDPIRFGLSFERFLNPTRKKQPDIDIDFQTSRRDDVLEHIKSYGAENVSHITNYVRLTTKSAFKDVTKVYGVPFQEANEFTTNLEQYEADGNIPKHFQKYYDKAKKLEGNIRHLGIHATGVIMTDKPFYHYLPTISSKGNVIAAIDGKTLTSKGFLKIDVCGIDALDIIHLTLKYIKKYEGKDIDLVHIDLKDEKVLQIFREGDTDNVFQFETYNFRELLKETNVVKFKNLIELNALNRPTPLSVGYHLEYIKRSWGEKYTTAKLIEDHLESTYGLLLYQEQTNNILADWLDLSVGEADNIRRDIENPEKGFRMVMEPYREKLYKKYGKEDVNEAFDELSQVVGYAFNKSHSCAYAYVAFQMAHLKCYYRKYFNLAVLNSEEKQEKIDRIINDCDKHDIHINAFDINEVSLHFTINKEGEITAGARIVKGLGEKTIDTIIKNKPYKNFNDFMERAKSITPKGNVRKIPCNVMKILYDNEFFENAWGKTENEKVERYLDNIASKKAAKTKKKGGNLFEGETKSKSRK
jgi:DNA polymerase-3 subunit alpha